MMQLNVKDGKYVTSTLYLAALLEYHGYLMSMTPNPVERGKFDFYVDVTEENHDDIQQLVSGFYDETLIVEPRAFGYSVKSVKDKLYNEKKAQG